MAWTTPKTDFVSGNILTAAQMNAIGENLVAVGGAWSSYTPTWTNLTVGSATQSSAYIAAGKLHVVRIKITLNGSTVGTGPEFTLPNSVSVNAAYNRMPLGWCSFFDDNAGALSFGLVAASVTSAARVRLVAPTTGTGIVFANVTATVPFTWANSDIIEAQFMFEAA